MDEEQRTPEDIDLRLCYRQPAMGTECKKDPVLILRIDGEDLREYVESTEFEHEAITILSQMDQADASLQKCLTLALRQLSVHHGMPPSSDPWVRCNIIEPALQLLSAELDEPISTETLFDKFKKLVKNISLLLHEQPVIVAHSEYTCDGSAIRRLLSNGFELNKLLDMVWRDLSRDRNLKTRKEYLLFALDRVAASAELPPHGTCEQVDDIVNGIVEVVTVDDVEIEQEQQFKKAVTEILESLSLRLGASPILVTSNLVIDEPLASSSSPNSALSD